MDLSKIPEPSEEELDRAEFLVEDQQYFVLTPDERILCRVIAHLLRHGSVLANSRRRFQDEGYSALYADERAAVSFFEKFGGDDER